jgi:transcriptional regulator GlxA family with amidase domain
MRRVAICVWNEAELLDFSGPGEVFAAADGGAAFEVYTVGESDAPIVSQGFLRVTPQYSIANCPRPDVIVLPGGGIHHLSVNASMVSWLITAAASAEVVLSVCTGAFLLAAAGLLDGLEATTWYGAIDRLRAAAPRTRVYADRRFVDNGRYVTSAGVSAGIDAALHVVARLLGTEKARETARYMEYDWDPDKYLPLRGEK